MAAIDPTTVRLSSGFLLSDFMGCDSVYRYGFANPISDNDWAKIEEGRLLANSLDALVDDIGHLSVTYGYIAPRLSKHIVKYQNPDKPSYHRWDFGAAADVCPHNWYYGDYHNTYDSPISWVNRIVQRDLFPYSRIITYSESEIVCVGTRSGEPPAHKIYENRYMEKEPKPKYVRYPTNDLHTQRRMLEISLREVTQLGWRGQGHPRYHGGGRRQYEHMRLGVRTLLSDFLYSPQKVHKGIPNRPPQGNEDFIFNSEMAARYNDRLTADNTWRHSIVFAFDCNSRPWTERFVIDYVPSPLCLGQYGEDGTLQYFEDAASNAGVVADVERVKMRKGENRIRVTGERV